MAKVAILVGFGPRNRPIAEALHRVISTGADADFRFVADADEAGRLLGGMPDRLDSIEAARDLATVALHRSRSRTPSAREVDAGVGVVLPTEWPRAGETFLAIQTASCTRSSVIDLGAIANDDEAVRALGTLAATALREGRGERGGDPTPWPPLPPCRSEIVRATEDQAGLLDGRTSMVCEWLGDRALQQRPRVVFPGSFHPVHDGHRRMARLASELLGLPVDLELTIRNADKPPLNFAALRSRIAAIRDAVASDPAIGHLWLTNAPRFPEKVPLFPGSTFVVGLDTFRRIGDPRFYGGPESMEASLRSMLARGAGFLVFYRDGDPLDGWDEAGRYPRRSRPWPDSSPENDTAMRIGSPLATCASGHRDGLADGRPVDQWAWSTKTPKMTATTSRKRPNQARWYWKPYSRRRFSRARIRWGMSAPSVRETSRNSRPAAHRPEADRGQEERRERPDDRPAGQARRRNPSSAREQRDDAEHDDQQADEPHLRAQVGDEPGLLGAELERANPARRVGSRWDSFRASHVQGTSRAGSAPPSPGDRRTCRPPGRLRRRGRQRGPIRRRASRGIASRGSAASRPRSSPTNFSSSGSQRSSRRRFRAMLSRWQTDTERWPTSTSQMGVSRLRTQSRKLPMWSSET